MGKRKQNDVEKEDIQKQINDHIQRIKLFILTKRNIYDTYVNTLEIHNQDIREYKKDDIKNSGKLREEYNACYSLIRDTASQITRLDLCHYGLVDTISELENKLKELNK
jgi:hypothetical protein